MKNTRSMWLITTLIILGIGISYIYQMAPSPILGILKEEFSIQGDALLNLSVSIIFPMMIIASIGGGIIEQKIGNKNLYILALVFVSVGILMNYFCQSYTVFLIGRAVYGIGFGLGIPFIGAAIMNWYTPEQQVKMNTINGFFPFMGTMTCFCLMVPLYRFFNNSWRQALGIWGIGSIVIAVLWALLTKSEGELAGDSIHEIEKGLYRNLWKRRSIKLLCLIFICDLFCFSYVSVILPTFILQIGNLSEQTAGFISAFAFPGVGIAGAFMGGILMSMTGRRKPPMAWGQLLKFAGLLLVVFGANTSLLVVVAGMASYGFGDGFWMPGVYMVGMELEDMNPARVGAAFALFSSCGYASGFISPILGGWLTDFLMPLAGMSDLSLSHVFGLKWSLFIFAFANLISFVCVLLLDETGPASASPSKIHPKVDGKIFEVSGHSNKMG